MNLRGVSKANLPSETITLGSRVGGCSVLIPSTGMMD